MKIIVKVKANARANEVTVDEGVYCVKVKEAPRGGKANDAIVILLADHFHVPRSAVMIRSGFTCRNKVVEVAGR